MQLEYTPEKVAHFWAKIAVGGPDECWPIAPRYQKKVRGKNYGQVVIDYQHWVAHRLAYYLTTGIHPGLLFVLHRCDTPPCCNPAHLFLGTNADNMADRDAKGRVAKGDRSGSRLHPERYRGPSNHSTKLTVEKVVQIRQRHAAGERVGKLAREYGVAQSAISHIISRRNWAYVP